MSNRTAKFVSAIFASLLAGAPLTTISHSAAQAADDCLSGPKGAPREGGHWYYRIDHATQRHCWYVRDEEKLSRAAPEDSPLPVNPVPANPVSPQKPIAAQRSIADAHAELPLPQTRIEPASTAAGPRTSAPAYTSSANTGVANTQSSLIATRWPGQSDVGLPITPESAAAGPPANAPSSPKVLPSTAVAAIPLAAADISSKSPLGSIPMLLTVIMGALSLAAVMGGAIFGFGGTRRIVQPDIRRHRRVNWDLTDIPREQRPADDPNRRIEQMLAQLSRGATS
jgi:hypothetical protein